MSPWKLFRAHLDFSAADVDAEVRHGSRRLEPPRGSGARTAYSFRCRVVLADPEGNAFCVVGQ